MNVFANKYILFFIGLFVFLTPDLYSQSIDFIVSSEVDLDASLSESSGLVYSRGKLWTHNDSGGKAEIYSVDPFSGSILQTISFEGLVNHDWEDLAVDENYLYIADTGNNTTGGRTNLAIYKVRLDEIPEIGDASISKDKVETISFFYPEQGIEPIPTGINNSPYDCEAIFVFNDTIHLFTKDWTSANDGYASSEYVLPILANKDGTKCPAHLLTRHENMGFLVTGADNWLSEKVILIGYQYEMMGAHCVRIYSDFEDGNISSGSNEIIVIGSALGLGQVEAICFAKDSSTGYISNELFSFSDFTYPAKLKSFSIVLE